MNEFNNIRLTYEHPDPQVKDYYSQCMRLIQSLRIKSDYQAKLSHKNYDVVGLTAGYVLGDDQQNVASEQNLLGWRYYQEITGEYLGAIEQTGIQIVQVKRPVIYIKSLDKAVDIPFTKDSMVDNPATRQAYRVGSYLLYELLEKYPEYETAIMGVLYPADDSVITAKDFSILAWDTSLIEEQEDNVIYELQRFINNFVARWHNQFYTNIDSYYFASFWANLTEALFLKLLNIRLENCKTPKAHSFHIKMYLASHYELDKYMRFMTKKQIMFLYRNLEYIANNSGKNHIFHLLKDKLLTDRQIPLSELSVRHIDEFTDLHQPQVHGRLKPINLVYESQNDYVQWSVVETMDSDNSTHNEQWYDRQGKKDEQRFQISHSGVVQTKVLHSIVIDITDAVEYPFPMVLLNHWGHLAKTGRFGALSYVSFTDPRDFKAYILPPMEAFVYYGLLLMHSFGYAPTSFGKFIAGKVFKYGPGLSLPNSTTLKQYMLSVAGISVPIIQDFVISVDALIRDSRYRPMSSAVDTPENLNTWCTYIYNFHRSVELLIATIQDPMHKAFAKNILRSLFDYKVYDIRLSAQGYTFDYTTVTEFLNNRGLNTDLDMSPAQYKLVLDEIFKGATGYFVAEETKKSNIQKAMVEVFKTLCSYTVKFVLDSNDRPIVLMPAQGAGVRKITHALGRAEVDVTVGLHMSFSDRVYVGDPAFGAHSKQVAQISKMRGSPVGKVTYPGIKGSLGNLTGKIGTANTNMVADISRFDGYVEDVPVV